MLSDQAHTFRRSPPRRRSRTPRGNVRVGSWSCKNAKRLKRDRISYSSKTALAVHHAIEFNLEVELKNIILVAFRYFEFYKAKGQSRRFDDAPITSGLPL
jgi:hypothetical protein